MKKLLVTVSGGRSSARMARHIQTSEKYKDYEKLYVFCNTGQERPETIKFLKDIVEHWGIPLNLIEGVYSEDPGVGVGYKIVDFDTLDMKSTPFTGAIKQLNKNKWTGVPNTGVPYCSDYLKTRPSHKFAKDVFKTTKYIKALGFRAEDMPKRISLAELKHNPYIIAPLLTDFEHPIGQLELNRFYEKEAFKLELHGKYGNCKLCWKKSERNLVESLQYGVDPFTISWYQKMENKYGNTFFRNKMSINDLIKIAESGTQLSLLDNDGDSCVCTFQ